MQVNVQGRRMPRTLAQGPAQHWHVHLLPAAGGTHGMGSDLHVIRRGNILMSSAADITSSADSNEKRRDVEEAESDLLTMRRLFPTQCR